MKRYAWPNHCMVYYKENKNVCLLCKEPRFKPMTKKRKDYALLGVKIFLHYSKTSTHLYGS